MIGMSLDAGGHLTHGFRPNISGKMFHQTSYGTDPETGLLDYDEVARLAREFRPLILMAGYSAYPRKVNFATMREIADEVGATLMVDMAHFAGLVAGKVFTGDFDPVPHAHVTTTTTHKSLRGPRGGMVLCQPEFADSVDRGCPMVLGGPLGHVMAAKAVALAEARRPSFQTYAQAVADNAVALAEGLVKRGATIVTGGTENHLVLIDVSSYGVTGRQAESALLDSGIVTNRNSIPRDPNGAWYTSGVRIGTPALTTRGFGTDEFDRVAELIVDVLSATTPGAGAGRHARARRSTRSPTASPTAPRPRPPSCSTPTRSIPASTSADRIRGRTVSDGASETGTVGLMFTIAPGTRAFGMQLPVQAQSNYFVADWERSAGPAEMARIARLCDEHGFAYVAVCDHVVIPETFAPSMGTFWVDPMATLGWLAGLTDRVMLLTHVYVLPFRQAELAAKQFATLDWLSGGRAICGIGVGHVEAEFQRLGVDHHRRGATTTERLPVMIQALEQEFVDGMGAAHGRSSRRALRCGSADRRMPPSLARRGSATGGSRKVRPRRELVDLLHRERDTAGLSDEPYAIGHIVPWIYVGTPDWDTGAGTITGSPEAIAEAVLASGPAEVNQLQVRFRSRSVDELADQVVAFATDVAPLLRTI